MSILSILQTAVRPSPLLAPQAVEALPSRADDTGPKDPQPISSGPPPNPMETSSRLKAAATQSRNDTQAPEAEEQILDEDTQSALVDANGGERLDIPRMSASLASALVTLNAKPASMAHLLAGSDEGPSFVEQAYSQLGRNTGTGPSDRIPYSKSA